ncbi:phosphoglycerate mutase GpmB [Microbulbifer aestuariivivens]|uniref:Phosphoglycerate mutase GpmB n=1 Tax=Microbulbifer aestuariivivens TaxID=1908308 RepID=A0ABP9WRA4_9GAMM
MAEFFTVRHGQASFGADDYDKLSELGWRQARWLGEHWRDQGLHFDRVLCGDLRRHWETARGICEGLGLPGDSAQLVPQLNEFDFHAVTRFYGQHQPEEVPEPGSPRSHYYRFLKSAMLAWTRGEITPQESWQAFEARIAEALAVVADAPRGSKTLVVSSAGAIAMMIRQVLGAAPDTVTRLNLQIRNTAVSHFFAGSGELSLHSFNHLPHLDTPQRREFITYS